jgi:hypothetical protein
MNARNSQLVITKRGNRVHRRDCPMFTGQPWVRLIRVSESKAAQLIYHPAEDARRYQPCGQCHPVIRDPQLALF